MYKIYEQNDEFSKFLKNSKIFEIKKKELNYFKIYEKTKIINNECKIYRIGCLELPETKGVYLFHSYNKFYKTLIILPNEYKQNIILSEELNRNEFYCGNNKVIIKSKLNYPSYLLHKNKIISEIYDNGTTPYVSRVYPDIKSIFINKISNKTLDKIKNNKIEKTNELYIYDELVYSNVYIKYFEAKKVSNSQGYGTGGSILAQIDTNKYIFANIFIKEFILPDNDTINTFYSLMGGSCVIYPIAKGDKYLYFLNNNDYISLEAFKNFDMTESDWEDGYSFYYKVHKYKLDFDKYPLKTINTKLITKKQLFYKF
jgi:hypothetical protein